MNKKFPLIFSMLVLITILPQAFPLGHASTGDVTYATNTTLTSDVSCSDLVISEGVTLTTNGFNIYCSGTFNNEGTIVTGNTPLQNFPDSYGGSGGGAQSHLCNAATGSGFSTNAPGGQGNSVDHAPTQGGSTPSPPSLTGGLITNWFQSGMSNFLAGAGGQTVCGDIIGGAGAYGLYVQANQIIAGTVDANGQMGSGTCSGRGLSGSGGGGAVLFSYGNGGYSSGTYNFNGGGGVPSCDGLSVSGTGGNGQVLTFNLGSTLQPHAPILIVGNSNFTGANGVIAGSGTASDPYLITGWNISTSTVDAIEIQNTTAHFDIRGNDIQSGLNSELILFGIQIKNSANFRILDNHVSQGPGLDIEHCVQVSIAGNLISPGDNNSGGMLIGSSTAVTVSNNIILGGGEDGYAFDLHGSSDVRVLGNLIAGGGPASASSSAAPGLTVADSTAIKISNNTASSIEVGSSSKLTISANLALALDGCIDVFASTKVNISSNRPPCISVTDSTDISVLANDVIGNHPGIPGTRFGSAALALDVASRVDVQENNVIPSAGDAIVSRSSLNITIAANNVMANTGTGILLAGSKGVQVFHNNLMGNRVQASDDLPNANHWDNYYPSGGNFWSDFKGADNCAGPSQSICPSPDGIADTPYAFSSNQDNYPLMRPFAPTIAGTVAYSPRIVSLQSDTKYLVAIIDLPSGFNASNIVASSIRLNGTLSPVSSAPGNDGTVNGRLKVKFDMGQVITILSRPGRHVLLVSANILTTTTFRPFLASATVRSLSCECKQS